MRCLPFQFNYADLPQWMVSGLSAFSYSCLSLAMVFANKEVFDAWNFPSKPLILVWQLVLCGCVFPVVSAYYKRRKTGVPRSTRAPIVASQVLAVLFVFDVMLGQFSSRTLGLDALATFRRLSIPLAMHLEVKTAQSSWSWPVAWSCWAMYLGPLIGFSFGRGKLENSTVVSGHAGWWDAVSTQGALAAFFSAATVAARVVYLKHVLVRHHVSNKAPLDVLRILRSSVVYVPTILGGTTPTVDYHHLTTEEDEEEEEQQGLLSHQDEEEEDTRRYAPSELLLDDDAAMSDGRDVWQQASRRKAQEVQKKPQRKRRRSGGGALDFAAALLSWNVVFSMPLALILLALDGRGVTKAVHFFPGWTQGYFCLSLISLVILSPLHEIAIYFCTLHNTALTTLVAGGFKSTALATYRALIASALTTAEPADVYDVIGMLISMTASLVYCHAWWSKQRQNSHQRLPPTFLDALDYELDENPIRKLSPGGSRHLEDEEDEDLEGPRVGYGS